MQTYVYVDDGHYGNSSAQKPVHEVPQASDFQPSAKEGGIITLHELVHDGSGPLQEVFQSPINGEMESLTYSKWKPTPRSPLPLATVVKWSPEVPAITNPESEFRISAKEPKAFQLSFSLSEEFELVGWIDMVALLGLLSLVLICIPYHTAYRLGPGQLFGFKALAHVM
ncbi:hypothetical protein QJS10_CPB14g00478 [Acorus calamus]|uniref:Uncharacterized protein n=1 Tax=Acorus calamus TaxID=4465 RepID=A0AAV9DE29_ACOCL|nr:hypothetical protein QJS10_CPB14g00478 [Acorus calamus]